MYKCMTKDIPLSSFASNIFFRSHESMLKCDSSDYENQCNTRPNPPSQSSQTSAVVRGCTDFCGLNRPGKDGRTETINSFDVTQAAIHLAVACGAFSAKVQRNQPVALVSRWAFLNTGSSGNEALTFAMTSCTVFEG